MATTPTKPIEVGDNAADARVPAWPAERNAPGQDSFHESGSRDGSSHSTGELRPSGRDALQALLAFSAMHQQVRQRRALASRVKGFETIARPAEFEADEQFVLDDVLQLVAERAIAITGADGIAIALAENNEIVLRASAGVIKPDVGARIDRDSAFSGACFRMAQIVRCDDTETDDRVNLEACRRLNARSMIAVPLCGRRRVIGVLEAFSIEPFGFNDSDVRSLELLAELVLGALKPEDEDRFAESAQAAATKLETAPAVKAPAPPISPTQAVAPPIAPAAITAPAISATAIPATAIPPAAKVEPLAKKELPPAAAPAKAAAAATAPITTEDEVAAILSGISAALIKPSAPAPVAP